MTISSFLAELTRSIPSERIITNEMQRFALSTDASFYRLVPQAVIEIDSEAEMVALIKSANNFQVPLTFRAAGTSLSGQAVTDSVLVTLSDRWRNLSIDPLGETVHVQPGVVGAKVNRALAPYGRKIGPDPASINACKIGGIVANNASGMCCGTKHNSYHTLKGLRLILADGTVLDTRDASSVEMFKKTHSVLINHISDLRQKMLEDSELVETVRHKYRLKNTTGYGINALLDFEDPIEILAHLIVGSEGTLGFISEVSLRTIDDFKHRASAMVGFNELETCAQTVSRLRSAPVDAVELLDTRAIRSVDHLPGLPDFAPSLPADGGMLLIDVRGADEQQLQVNLAQVQAVLDESGVTHSTGFTNDTTRIEQFWNIRKGTFPAVGAVREAGTTVIIEDVAFPIEKLSEGVARLQALFDEYHYDEAIIFGHALEGNLHFVFTQAFDDPAEIARYEGFMDAVSQMVAVDFGGSLKAEHGTGRNMAPFVKLEWGDQAFDIMQAIKRILDPDNLLNPGVILNDDDKVHVKNLKSMTKSEESIDKCIECGFCEDVCPSKDLSLTPRQRIAVYREMQRRLNEKVDISQQWHQTFQYQGVDTCAATGLCETRCPVGINTGDLVLKIRARNNHKYRRLAKSLARHFAAVASWVRGGLVIGHWTQKLFGAQRLERLTEQGRRFTNGAIPLWLSTTPGRSGPIYARNERIEPNAQDTVVYWASCVSQSMGGSTLDDRKSITTAVQSVLQKAQLKVVYPQPTRGLCCGQPFRSKGHASVAERMMNEVLDALWEVSSGGRYPILSDTSPCALQLKDAAAKRGLHLYDSSEFIDRFLLNRLHILPEQKPVAVHTTCSTQKQGIEKSFQRVLDRVAPNWTQPVDMHCCGFAGDKGFTKPELNASALKGLAVEVRDCEFGISTSRTCEIGLSKHSGLTYYSLFEVLDRCSQTFPELEVES
jgi:D-lactate dehydrogenase